MRLDKLLSHTGYGSRKEVKEWIRKGYISVNGVVIQNDDYKVNELEDEVLFLDESVHYEKLVYILLNKPAGYVSATFDLHDPTVIDLIQEYQKGIFPVGRLDKDTTGLLLITNDGKLAHNFLSPSKHVNKVYEFTFAGKFLPSYFSKFQEGILLDDGYLCMPAVVEIDQLQHGFITIQEGKYHQVKRMFQALGLEITSLKRISFGSLSLPSHLKEGEYVYLTEAEIQALF